MSFGIELCSFWTSGTIFFKKIKNWFITSTVDTFRIWASQERSLKWTFGNIIIGNELEQLFIVIIDSLVTNDPVSSIEVTDILIICLFLTDAPTLSKSVGSLLLVWDWDWDEDQSQEKC